MMSPDDVAAVIQQQTIDAVEVASVACLRQMRERGMEKAQAAIAVDAALAMIKQGMPEVVREIADACHRFAAAESDGEIQRDDACSAMRTTAYATYAHLGFLVGDSLCDAFNVIARGDAEKGGAA